MKLYFLAFRKKMSLIYRITMFREQSNYPYSSEIIKCSSIYEAILMVLKLSKSMNINSDKSTVMHELENYIHGLENSVFLKFEEGKDRSGVILFNKIDEKTVVKALKKIKNMNSLDE